MITINRDINRHDLVITYRVFVGRTYCGHFIVTDNREFLVCKNSIGSLYATHYPNITSYMQAVKYLVGV